MPRLGAGQCIQDAPMAAGKDSGAASVTRRRSSGGLEWLVALRGKRTQADVAAEVGISQQQYSHIETGRQAPSVKTAKRIASVIGFDWTMFFNDDLEKEESR